MNDEDTCTVVLATLNGQAYLQDQLKSFSKQTHPIHELIASDDGSSDNTLAILTEFAAHADFPVRILEGPQFGYGENFASAARHASGQYIFFSDQDDVWFPEKLETMLAVHKSSQALVVVHDLLLMDENGLSLRETFLERLHRFGYSGDDHVKGCATSLHRILVPTLSFRPDYIAHDHWINLVGRKLASRVLYPSPLAYYRLHKESTSRWWMNDPQPVGQHRRSVSRLRHPFQLIGSRFRRLLRARFESRQIRLAIDSLKSEIA